jgi:GMP synthase (glutamine-hydrolysing) B subunit
MMVTGTDFDPQVHIEKTIARLRGMACRDVLVAVSGGIDSTTAAALLRAAGCLSRHLMIDTGFLRHGEPETPCRLLQAQGLQVEVADEREAFQDALKGVVDSGQKRAVFRDLYFDVISDYMLRNDIRVIAQGSQLHQIIAKQAHNAPTEPFLNNRFETVEPVLGLTKSQVRSVARTLGLPDQCVSLRPFPGPGLLLRFGGEYSPRKLDLVRTVTYVVDAFVTEHEADFADCYQIFPYLADGEPVTYVDHNGAGGVGSVLLLRAVREHYVGETITYHPFTLPATLFPRLVERLMAISGVARVCMDLTPKFGYGIKVAPGATIEYA